MTEAQKRYKFFSRLAQDAEATEYLFKGWLQRSEREYLGVLRNAESTEKQISVAQGALNVLDSFKELPERARLAYESESKILRKGNGRTNGINARSGS